MKLRFYNSFTFRIFVLISLTIFLSLSVLTALNVYTTIHEELRQQTYSGTNTLDQTSSFLSYRIHAIEGIMNVVSYDDTIQTVISTSGGYYSKNIANWNIHTTDCREILYNSYTTDNIDEIRLYSATGPAAIEETDEFKRLSSAEQTIWYDRINNSGKSSLWFPASFFGGDENEGHILYVKKIADLQKLGHNLGFITASVPVSKIEDIVSMGELTVNTSLMIINSYNEIIAARNNPFSQPSEILRLAGQNGLTDDAALKQIKYQGNRYLMGCRELQNSDWKLVMMVPYRDVFDTVLEFLGRTAIAMICVILLCLPFVFKLSESLNSRIVVLKNMMEQSSTGHFLTEPIDNGSDEIGELTQSFYDMQMKIARLAEDQYQLGYEIKDLEFQVLQSQINPHFLYNTLDMIHWMGLKHNCIEISEAAGKLGEFYSLSLSHGDTLVPIQNELRHIQAYVNIQNMRFENRITLINQVPPELYGFYMLKIILQPLVENSISHGIMEREDETGSVLVGGMRDGQKILLTVSDNGVGIPRDRMEGILEKNRQHRQHGYGVWNIHERLRMAYGPEYGLSYQSEPGMGTTVTITLPVIESPDATPSAGPKMPE